MSDSLPEITDPQRGRYQNIGLLAGPALFVLMMLLGANQTTMDPTAWRVAAVGMWMALWWATESAPVPVTAFLPIITFPFLEITTLADATSHYANPIIYLFMGAFILALAVERWNLHKRIALVILSYTGTDGRNLVGSFMVVAALLSMWMTNTSTTMMLMPIALSVTHIISEQNAHLNKRQIKSFQVAMLLGLAYAATIGGLATLVGTPPNALLAAFLNENYDIKLTFASWMALGIPVMLLMLPLAWWSLTRWTFKIDIPANPVVHEHLTELRQALGPMSRAEKRVAIVFALVVTFWIVRRPISLLLGIDFLTDTGIVMTAALLLFLLPSGNKAQPQIMTWDDVSRLPWGVLILFGGGLSLAAAVSSSGLAAWLGSSLMPLGTFGVFVLVIAATALVIFLTELTSNVATAATFLPVVAAVALELGVSPLVLCIPITLAASCAFMLPVATPPNAIVFASGLLNIPQMIKAGFVLNIVGLILISAVSLWLAPLIFL
ncbi:DASS family sodium-coupled anion symporter [Aliiglaciecola sp. 2_MG-2023]|uniref:SLC13 family permease n=1 Tax=unclassified Aliiglaciecola TaxID=2593648 RepID=UPI0026E14315|nr:MULTISPECIES: DASS family sodium-coupled anion symporter [unclassified Aliiglaciecola]MDO6710620.1 DASS family sodium-coupled anion symporter [Aliiglaciecola sp. 2_MG-2023]MDO6754293.1 DASS family sodium-coupled anion symporter [Aliiglaciecola sp. 1_MG-2023]